MNKIANYFIGDILKSTEDVFEQARAILLLRLNIMFAIIFVLPLVADFVLGYEVAAVLHCFAFIMLLTMPFIIRAQKDINKSINLFFGITFLITFLAGMILNPHTVDPIAIAWSILFLMLSTLMQRGKMRILFACFLLWFPVMYVIFNIMLGGVLTVKLLEQKGAESPPIFLLFFPIVLAVYTIWTHASTIQQAKETIIIQKQLIAEKNRDIIDSIQYAQRIQNSLLPTERYIDKSFKRLKKL